MKREERRFKCIRATHEDLLRCMEPGEGFVAKMVFPKLPADTRIHSVYPDYSYMGVNILLTSKEFDDLPDGQIVPTIETTREIVQVKIGEKEPYKPLL